MKNPIDILKNAHYKITPARISVLSLFFNDCKPLNAEDVISSLKKNKIDDVTVYRTLNSFEKKGILKQLNLRKGSVYYELAYDHHHHIICTECGRIEDFDTCSVLKNTEKILKKSTNFKKIQEHSLELFGICNTCQKV